MAAREHSRSGRVHPDATVMTSRRALLGAVLAAPALTAANVFARHPGLDPGPTFFSPPPQGRGIPDQVRNDESGAAQPFAVTKGDHAPSLPDDPEPGRKVRDDDSDKAQSSAVTKWDRALARFRRAERIVKAAEGEPDEDRYDILLGRFNDTLRRLLRAPAPHLPALAAKLAAANRHLAWELTGAETCIAALARDARRLAATSRSS